MLKRICEFVFGAPLPARLPERVRKAIDRQQEQGEILIGWVQLFMVVFFATIYAIAPKPQGGTGFTPVIIALSLYLLFTVARLVIAYRRGLNRWLLTGSVVMDMGMLMVLIWSFHLQYAQPPSFYLKVPTMLYVFIFITLRALRFEPLYILVAGGVAALGWFILMLFAIITDPKITLDFVVYMTSNSILIGAEIDKIMTILLVTMVLAVAVLRAQRQMTRAVLDSMAAQELSRFVSPEVVERIAVADEEMRPGDGELKIITAMFTDIEGFATISERSKPDDLMELLNDYFSDMSEIAKGYNGVISQFVGDGLLITFNAVKPDADHAANAVRTAIEIQRRLGVRQFKNGVMLKTRCGINTGEAMVGAFGSKDRLLFTVHGDEINVAARLEQLNKEYGSYVLASESTVKAAGDNFKFKLMGEVTVRGRKTATCVYTTNH